MSDVLNEFWHISAEEDGIDNIAVALTTYFESLPDCPEGAPINDEHGWTNFAMEKFENLDKRVTEHFQQLTDENRALREDAPKTVIDILRNRKGFRWWWDDLSPDIQNDIYSCIDEALAKQQDR